MSYAAKVRRGVELLDREMPGWHEQIRVQFLDIHSLSDCVLGQLFGSWREGADRVLGPRTHWTNDRGPAYGLDGTPGDDYKTECDTLTRLWAYVVKTRQARDE